MTSGGAALIFPRGKGSLGQKKIGRGGAPVRLTKELLENCMHLSICEASKLLGLSKTSVKKACRAVGITSWRQSSTATKFEAATALCLSPIKPASADVLDDGDASTDTNEDTGSARSSPETLRRTTDLYNPAHIAAINYLLEHRSDSSAPMRAPSAYHCTFSGVANMPAFPSRLPPFSADYRNPSNTPLLHSILPFQTGMSQPPMNLDLQMMHHQLEHERFLLEGKFASFRRLVEEGPPPMVSHPTPVRVQPAQWAPSPSMQSGGVLPMHASPLTMALNAPHGALPAMCALPSSALAKLLRDSQRTRTLHCV